jgi:hypothetical protein
MFSGIVFALEINSEKRKIYRIGPSLRPDPTHSGPSAPAQPPGPRVAHRPGSHGAAASGRDCPARAPIKREARVRASPRRPPAAAALRAASACWGAKPEPPPGNRTEFAGIDRGIRLPPFVSAHGEHTHALPSSPSSDS